MKQERIGAALLLCFLLLMAAYGCKYEKNVQPADPSPQFEAQAFIGAPSAAPQNVPDVEASLQQLGVAGTGAVWLTADEAEGFTLWRSDNGGSSWARLLFRNMYVSAVYPEDYDTGWIIGKSGCQQADGEEPEACGKLGIYSTVDGGANWNSKWELEAAAVSLTSDQIWFADEQSGFALVDSIMLRTRNGGELWLEETFEQLEGNFVPEKMAFTDPDKGWVAGSLDADCGETQPDAAEAEQTCGMLAVVYTGDGGSSWQLQHVPEASGQAVGEISFFTAESGRLQAYDGGTLEETIYTTEDGGQTWIKRPDLQNQPPQSRELRFLSLDDGGRPTPVVLGSSAGSVNVSFADGRKGWLLEKEAGSGAALFYTVDGGASWINIRLKQPEKEGTAYFNASVWRQAVAANGLELWVKAGEPELEASSGVKIIAGVKQRTFPWVVELGEDYLPKVVKADVDADGKWEWIIVLTEGHGTGILKQRVHVLREDLSEIPLESPLRAVKREVESRVEIAGGQVYAFLRTDHAEYSFQFEKEDAGYWFEDIAFGSRTVYRIEQGRLGFLVSAAVSPGTFLGHIQGEYEYREGKLVPANLRYKRDSL